MSSTAIISMKNWLVLAGSVIMTGFDIVAVKVLCVFMMIDIVTGIFSAARRNGWNSVTSTRGSFGIIFKLSVMIVPFMLVWIGKAIHLDMMVLAIWALNALIISEALSIIGNMQEIKTGIEVAEIDAFSLILKKVRRFLLALLEKYK